LLFDGNQVGSTQRVAQDCTAWKPHPVFSWLQKLGNISEQEMLSTFNCGIGMILVVSRQHLSDVQKQLELAGSLKIYNIGSVVEQRTQNLNSRVYYENVDDLFDASFFDDSEFIHRKRVNVAILISGSGSNMAQLIHQSHQRNSHCYVSVVISNNSNVLGLDVARSLGVQAIVIPSQGISREDFEAQVTKELESRHIDLICLAGFMRVLTAGFIARWRQKIINIHPSLLPSFKGAKAVALALEAGVKITGCTAHFVVEDIDAGQILGQEAIAIEPVDNEASVHKKIQAKEHALFPRVMEEVAKRMIDQK